MKRQVGIIFLLFFCCSNNLAMNNNNEKKMKNKGIRSSNDCAIVFRTRCNPGPALELRILRWSRSLSARPIGQRCDIWVSSDVSRKLYTEKEILFASSGVLKTLHVNKNKNKNTVRNDAKSVWFDDPRKDVVKQMEFTEMEQRNGAKISDETSSNNYMWQSLPENDIHRWWLHNYTVHNIASTFPHIFALDRLCRKHLKGGYCDIWARIYQTEFILLWMKAAREHNFKQYSKVWVIQDDVEYTGDPATFLFSPEFLNADFVSPHAIAAIRQKHEAEKISTLSFASNFESGKLYFAGEGVRKYSWNFLSLLYDYATLGESAWSELSAASICKHRPTRCKSTHFPRTVFSARWEWEDQTKCILSAETLDLKLRWWSSEQSDIWQDKWVHKVTDDRAPHFVYGTCLVASAAVVAGGQGHECVDTTGWKGIQTIKECSDTCLRYPFFVHVTQGDGNCKCCTNSNPLSQLVLKENYNVYSQTPTLVYQEPNEFNEPHHNELFTRIHTIITKNTTGNRFACVLAFSIFMFMGLVVMGIRKGFINIKKPEKNTSLHHV